MTDTYIKAISYYLPPDVLDNERLSEEFPEWSAEKISSKTGIYQRHIAGQDMLSSDMAVLAAEKLFAEHNISPSEIDFILLCTQSPDYFLPTTTCILQDRLKIPTTAGALDFNLGCSGYVYGLALAKGLVSAGIAKNILFITAETYSKFIHPSDKSNRTIFGDAASATLVSSMGGFATIGDFDLGTDGKGANNLIVKNGGMRHPMQGEQHAVTTDEWGNVTGDDYLYMNGSEIFNFTLESVPVLVKNTLSKNRLAAEEVDLYVFHQANRFMLNHLRKKLKIPEDKFYIFLENCGNTVSSTIPIALKEAMNSGAIKQHQKVLLAGFGVGYSWGGTLLNYV